MAFIALLLRSQRHRWLSATRNCSQLTSQQSSTDQHMSLDEEPQIPMVPKRRDPHAVLKALESTIEPVEYEIFRGMGPANPMYPYSKFLRMDYVRHLEAGRKAAKYILNRWPRTFMYKKLDSDPVEFEKKPLERNILKKQRHQAWWIYKKMKANREKIPLETRNNLLALLAHFGLGNAWATEEDAGKVLEVQRDLSWWPATSEDAAQSSKMQRVEEVEGGRETESSDRSCASEERITEAKRDNRDTLRTNLAQAGGLSGKTGSDGGKPQAWQVRRGRAKSGGRKLERKKPEYVVDEETGVKLSTTKIRDGVKIWRMDSAAEQLFNDITEKNGLTYEALIEGLVKHKNYKRAFEMFEEMRANGYQAHTQTYNLLFASLLDVSRGAPKAWSKAMHLLCQMKKEPVAMPDAGTFNLLLQIASGNSSAIELIGRIMRELFHIGVEPTLTTFYWLIQPYLQKGGPYVLEEVVSYLEKNPQVLKIQDSHCHVFFREAMNGCSKVKDHALAMRLKKVSESACNSGLVDNPIQFMNTYMAILCGGGGTIDNLKSEYRRLYPKRELRHEWVFGFIFKACWEAGDQEFAVEVFKDMEKFDVGVRRIETIVHLSIALKKASSPEIAKRNLEALEEGIRRLKANDIRVTSSILISNMMKLALMCGDVDKIWRYFRMFENAKLQPSFEGFTILLKALYKIKGTEDTTGEDRATVKWVFESMANRGMSLPPRYVRNLCQSFDIDEKLSNEFIRSLSRPTASKTTAQYYQ